MRYSKMFVESALHVQLRPAVAEVEQDKSYWKLSLPEL